MRPEFDSASIILQELISQGVGQHPEGVVLGYIYFIEEIGTDRVKIGYSMKPWKRLNSLRTSIANDLRILWIFSGTRANEIECHWVFQNHRIRGEWFQLSAVVAGFKHYGFDPVSFPDPRMVRDSLDARRKKVGQQLDPGNYERINGFLVRGKKKRDTKLKKNKRKGGVKWSSEEYQAKAGGMTIQELRDMKKRIRLEWLAEHPEDRRWDDPW